MTWDKFSHAGFRAGRPGPALGAAALAGHLIRRAACLRSWPRTGPRCSPTPIMRTCSPAGQAWPSLPAARMAAVLTLQVLHDYAGRETAEAVRFDVR